MRFTCIIFLCAMLFAHCTTAKPSKNTTNYGPDFEVFYQTFRRHYALFDVKQVNWDSLYTRFRPRVQARMKEAAFAALLGEMVTPLNDAHITIARGETTYFKGSHPSAFRTAFRGKELEFWKMVYTDLAEQGFGPIHQVGPLFRNEALFETGHSTNATYIRITRCFGTVESLYDDAAETEDLTLMLRLWDSLLVAVQNKPRLIIDLRSNGGGHGGREMASRLLSERTLTHAIALRDSAIGFGPAQPQYLEPFNGIRYRNKVVLLTSDRTASSAEDFALSLATAPKVLRVGTRTSGSFSDMFNFTLQGGLEVTLSHQRYLDAAGQPLEGRGVPVQHTIANTFTDLQNKQDPVLRAAIVL